LSGRQSRAPLEAAIRPPDSYASGLKVKQLAQWHYEAKNHSCYDQDQLISLELGGAPRSKKNLSPTPWSQATETCLAAPTNVHRPVQRKGEAQA
jgi:hypothetical protein